MCPARNFMQPMLARSRDEFTASSYSRSRSAPLQTTWFVWLTCTTRALTRTEARALPVFCFTLRPTTTACRCWTQSRRRARRRSRSDSTARCLCRCATRTHPTWWTAHQRATLRPLICVIKKYLCLSSFEPAYIYCDSGALSTEPLPRGILTLCYAQYLYRSDSALHSLQLECGALNLSLPKISATTWTTWTTQILNVLIDEWDESNESMTLDNH